MKRLLAGIAVGAVLTFPLAAGASHSGADTNARLTQRVNHLCKLAVTQDNFNQRARRVACPNVLGAIGS